MRGGACSTIRWHEVTGRPAGQGLLTLWLWLLARPIHKLAPDLSSHSTGAAGARIVHLCPGMELCAVTSVLHCAGHEREPDGARHGYWSPGDSSDTSKSLVLL